MASLLQAQGKLNEAEPLFREALEAVRATLGEHHPNTLASFNSMASLLQAHQASKEISTLLASRPRHLSPDYLRPSAQHSMKPHHRERAVKDVNDLAEYFGLPVQTGGVACNYFDRYIANVLKRGNPNIKSRMQMIASTCLLIAAKFFDRKLPKLSELEALHSGSVTAAEFAALEIEILEVLQWQLYVPMPHAFIAPLRQLLPDAPFGEVVEDRMQFFIDLSVYSYELLQYSAAEIAAGALLAAWILSGEHVTVKRYVTPLARGCYTVDARLSACAKSLIDYFKEIFKGFRHRRFPPAAAGSTELVCERAGAESPDSVFDQLQPSSTSSCLRDVANAKVVAAAKRTAMEKAAPADATEVATAETAKRKVTEETVTDTTVKETNKATAIAARATKVAKTAAAARAAEVASIIKAVARGREEDATAKAKANEDRTAVKAMAMTPPPRDGPQLEGRVFVTGLVGRPDLNGLCGQVVSYNSTLARYTLLLDSGASFALNAVNISCLRKPAILTTHAMDMRKMTTPSPPTVCTSYDVAKDTLPTAAAPKAKVGRAIAELSAAPSPPCSPPIAEASTLTKPVDASEPHRLLTLAVSLLLVCSAALGAAVALSDFE